MWKHLQGAPASMAPPLMCIKHVLCVGNTQSWLGHPEASWCGSYWDQGIRGTKYCRWRKRRTFCVLPAAYPKQNHIPPPLTFRNCKILFSNNCCICPALDASNKQIWIFQVCEWKWKLPRQRKVNRDLQLLNRGGGGIWHKFGTNTYLLQHFRICQISIWTISKKSACLKHA